jgi:hypothetical protein
MTTLDSIPECSDYLLKHTAFKITIIKSCILGVRVAYWGEGGGSIFDKNDEIKKISELGVLSLPGDPCSHPLLQAS